MRERSWIRQNSAEASVWHGLLVSRAGLPARRRGPARWAHRYADAGSESIGVGSSVPLRTRNPERPKARKMDWGSERKGRCDPLPAPVAPSRLALRWREAVGGVRQGPRSGKSTVGNAFRTSHVHTRVGMAPGIRAGLAWPLGQTVHCPSSDWPKAGHVAE